MNIKKLNDKDKKNVLIKLIYEEGFQRNEILKTSDYNEMNELLNDIEKFNLPTRFDRLGIDLHTLQKQIYIEQHPEDKEIINDIINNIDNRGKMLITSKEFITKHHQSLFHFNMLLNKKVLNKYSSEELSYLRELNRILQQMGNVSGLIKISNLLIKRHLLLTDFCDYYNLNFEIMRKLMKAYHIQQSLNHSNKEKINKKIIELSEEIKQHPMFKIKIDELNNGKIFIKDFAKYFILNEKIAEEIICYLYNDNKLQELKDLKASILSFNSQATKMNSYINKQKKKQPKKVKKNKIKNPNHHLTNPEIIEKRFKTNLEKYGFTNSKRGLMIEKKWNIIENDSQLKKLFEDEIDLLRKDRNIYLWNILQNDGILLYEKFYNKFGYIDSYPDGVIDKITLRGFNKKSALKLNALDLLEINYKRSKYSRYELKLTDNLQNLIQKYNVIFNDRKALYKDSKTYYEIDLYFPNQKIGIEINPNYTHNSNKFKLKGVSKNENYHYKKYLFAKEKDIKLIQLFENDLSEPNFTNITLPRINALFNEKIIKIAGRKVEINNITNNNHEIKNIRQFLDQYHSSGKANANYKYEIKYQNELIGVVLFSNTKIKNQIEIKRLCVKPDIKIHGLISKIIKRFFKDYPEYQTMLTYSDNNFGDGLSYQKAGFKFIKETKQSVKFISESNVNDNYSRHIMLNLNSDQAIINKDRISKGLKPYYEEKFNVQEYIETELSHRLDNQKGYDVIYTAGSKRWELNKDDLSYL